MAILKNWPIFEKYTVLQPMLFSKKWLKNHPQFLLHFLIHIDVLILCRKFELISLNNFQVMIIFKNEPIFEKSMDYSPWFFQKMAQKSPPIFITFSDAY